MKKILSLILALVMVLGLVPVAALASETEETEENLWSGRSAVFVGDSITAGTGTTKIYYEYLNENLNLGSVTAMGVPGSCVSAASNYGNSKQPLINRYQDIPSADLIVIFMGTNDYGHETPLGSVEDTADGTFYGALNVIIPALVEKHTSSKIVFVTSLHRYGAGTSQILGTKFTYDNIPNGVGAALGDYVDALKTVCANNDVSVIDLYTECTLDPSDATVRSTYMPDGIHPNAAGHEVIAGIMESHIRGYEPAEKEPIKLAELVQGNKFAAGNDQPCRASSRINYYLKAGTVITLKDPAAMQWACARTSGENSSNNLGYFPDAQWTDKVTAVVAEDGWIGFTFKYRDETQAFDLTRPLSDLITIEEPHTHIYEATVTAPTCTEQGYTTYTCTVCGDSYVDDYVNATGHTYANGICTGCGAEAPDPEDFTGKSVAILSHSMSTYAGVSNNTSYNSTIGNNDVYYTAGKHGVYQKDTWWQQAIDALGMELLVNNSWSGSCVFMPRRGEASVGYGDRAVNLHNDRTGEEPEIIWVYLGCNDFAYYKDTFGKAEDVDYDALIRDNGDETFTYATPTTTCEAYAIMLHKVAHRYPDAEIYCMTSTARRETDYTGDSYPDAGQPTEYSAQLQQIAAYWGYPVVGLEKAIPKDVEIFDKYMGDKRAHANQLGMDQITNAVLSVMLGENAEIRHVTSENGVVAEQAVLLGGSYSAEVEIRDGYSVVVTMGGKDVTDEVYKDGRITIAEVTGDIAVSAVITRDPLNFRWEFKDDELTSVGETENTLLELSATVENGILNDGRYELTIPVVLKHDRPWSVEWKCAENWRGVLLSSDPAPAAGMTYLSRVNGGQLCFGVWTGTQYNNYGVDISDLDNQVHTYRLENRIAADGSNMVWLYVDGIEIGSMIHYFIGSKDQNATSDWVRSKDFIFSYIGIESHALRNCRLDYLEVTECEHVYENGVCVVCGEEHPNLASFEGKVISILGDSISTFAGYIPVADGFNLEHLARYPQDNLLTDVNETWWMQVITALGGKLGINDSWRGATVSGAVPVTTGTTGENAAMSNLTRIQNLGANGTPDVILFYGGTNDLAHVSKVGSFDPNTAPTTVDLTTKKWDNLAEAYVHTLLRLRHFYPDAQIVCLLPTYTTSYYSNTKLAQANEVLAQICEHYGVAYTDLRECGITTADLPDGIHPNAAGMDFITEATVETVLDECEMEAGENVVHSVTHTLTGAKSSLSYYKGVTHGKAFVTAITGEEVTVSVTMGGVDITDAVYADGVITIAEVTGDVAITAQGRVKTIYEDYLQQLPDEVCAGLNLWNVLEHDAEYYTVSGWGVHDSGKVYSVTFPVSAGDRIYATSFGAAGSNGQSSVNGIRTTFFDADGLLITMGADKVYAEFAANGFITAPDGAVAVNIPMWSVSDDNEIYVLSRPHIYDDWHESSDGEERRDCLICDHYETRKIIAAMVGENQYTSLDAAIEAASAVHGTVTLLTDLTVKGVVIPSGVTLDLADYSLTAGYIVGLNGGYLTATPNAGRLIVSKSSLFLAGQGFKNASGQYILPVWDPEQSCYVFSLFVVNTNNAERGLFIDEENETIRFQFKHQATGDINKGLLDDGSSDNALKVIVRLVWESENGEAYQDFVYNDGFVKKVAVGENGVSYDYSFTLTGYSAMNIKLDTLKVVGMIITDSGAVASGTVWTAEMAK